MIKIIFGMVVAGLSPQICFGVETDTGVSLDRIFHEELMEVGTLAGLVQLRAEYQVISSHRWLCERQKDNGELPSACFSFAQAASESDFFRSQWSQEWNQKIEELCVVALHHQSAVTLKALSSQILLLPEGSRCRQAALGKLEKLEYQAQSRY